MMDYIHRLSLTMAFIALTCLSAGAQELNAQEQEQPRTEETSVQETDSVSVRDLGEIVVEAQRDYISGDKAVFRPDSNAKNASYNAGSLLSAMAIPMLNVSPQGDVKMANGEAVAIFIDFLPASAEDMSGLRPSDVRSVEIYTNSPDPRFHGAPYVINFVMVQYKYGGYTKIDASQQVMETQGFYGVKSKFVTGRMTYDVAGGFNFADRTHNGSNAVREYRFPQETLTTVSDLLDSHDKSHGGYVSARGVYGTRTISIANTLRYQGTRNPGSHSTSALEYRPAWYPTGLSTNTSESRYNGINWDGNWYFSLPHGMGLVLTPNATYATNTSNTSFTNSGATILNLGHEKSWQTQLLATLSKSLGRQNVYVTLRGNNQGNSIRYEGTTPSKTLGRTQEAVFALGANLQFGRFRISPSANASYSHVSFGNLSRAQWVPKVFVWSNYSFSQRSSLSLTLQLTAMTVPLNQMNPEFVMETLVTAVQGNPLLKQSPLTYAQLFYTYLFSDRLSMTLFANWARYGNLMSAYYSPETVDGHPVMVLRMGNEGFLSNVTYGAQFTAHLLNRSLVLEAMIRGRNDRVHSFSGKALDCVWVGASATYYYRKWFAKVWWQAREKDMNVLYVSSSPARYGLSLGYGYRNLSVRVSADNLFNSSWKTADSHVWMSNYDAMTVNYGDGCHRSFTVNLSYSFGYGKRIERGNELEGGVSISSGLVN